MRKNYLIITITDSGVLPLKLDSVLGIVSGERAQTYGCRKNP